MSESGYGGDALSRAAMRAVKVGSWSWGFSTGRVTLSAESKGLLGYSDADAPADPVEWERRVHPEDLPRLRQQLTAYMANPWPECRTEFRVRHKDGTWRWVLVHADVERDPGGRPARMVGSHVDITEQKRVESDLSRANRALRMLCEANQALMRASDEASLLHQVCRAVVEAGGYRMARVGFAEADEEGGFRLAAQAGFETVEPGATAPAPRPERPSSSELAFQTGEPVIARDLLPEATGDRPRGAARERGCQSAIALPLILEGRTIGVLKVCAAEPDRFDADEVAALQELVRDLAFGIGVVRTRASRDRDIAERKAAEQALRNSEEMYRSVVSAMAEGVVFQAASGEITAVNPAAERIQGRTPEQMLGKTSEAPDWDAIREDGTPFPGDQHPSMVTLRTGRPQSNVIMGIRRPDAQRVWISINSAPLFRPGEAQPYAVVTTFHDITARREAEAAARAREREYRTLAENTPDFIVRWNRELDRVYVNPAFAASMGVPVDALVGLPFGSRYPAETMAALGQARETLRDRLRAVFATGQPTEIELPWHTVAGPRVFHTRMIPERAADGTVATVLGIGRDITGIKETERQLRTLAEHSPDIILRFDPEGRYLYANRALERITGVPAQDHIGRLLGEVTGVGVLGASPSVYQALRRRIGEAAEAGEQSQTEVMLPLADGMHLFDVRLIPEANETGAVASVLAVARDITEQRRAEEALRGSEQRFRQMTETIDEVFWLTDVTKREMIYLSPAYERVFGRSCESVYADPASWLDAVHPEDRPRVRAALPLQPQGGYDVEYRILRERGVIRWIHERAFPIADAEGRPYRIAGVAEDVTVRRQLEDRLRQAQKMEAVGQLAGGIAHDFNNMLAVIQMQSSLLLESAPVTPETREGIQEILAATERASNLTRQLLTFSRRQVAQLADLDIGETIGTMTKLLRRILGEDISLETRFAPGLPLLRADPGMIEQVLMNLAINARDAMPGGGRLTVTLDPIEVSAERAAVHPGSAAGAYVCLAVTDTGSGIPAEALPRIFEPFFTTKDVGRGTGLGLATVFGIVEQHHGWIEVESDLDHGTTFRVLLPAWKGPGVPAAPQPLRAEVRGGNETILLVEDETAVRGVTRVALERLGYRILEAGSAAEAIDIWDEVKGQVDLLLTDLIMPGGASGRELARQLSARAPALRVLYTSGYSADLLNRLVPLEPGRILLQKPYTPQELGECVRRCLDQEVAGTG